MHPILFSIGDFVVPAYGVILVAVFLLCNWLLKKEAVHAGLDPQKVSDAAIGGLLFGLLGAKLMLILVDLPDYLADPRALLGTLRSAGVIYGGQIGGALGAFYMIRRRKLPLWTSIDLMTPFLALGIGLGRLSCLMAGCCYGIPYDGPLALVFPEHPYCDAPSGLGLFPIQVVSLVNGVGLFFFLRFVLRRRRFGGQVFALFMITYGLTRGTIEFFRSDSVRGLWFGDMISTSQIMAILGIVAGSILYLKMKKVGT